MIGWIKRKLARSPRPLSLAEARAYVKRIPFGDADGFVCVRKLTLADLEVFQAIDDLPEFEAIRVAFRYLYSDIEGNRVYRDGEDVSAWPMDLMKRVMEEGIVFSGLREDIDQLEKK